MTGFDFVVLAILLASVLLSTLRGFVRELLSLVAFVASFVAAIWWGPRVYDALMPYIQADLLRLGAAYLGVFFLALLLLGLLNLALATVIRSTGLAPVDRGLGALFGLARGLLIVFILVVVAGYTPMPSEAWWRTAWLSPLAERSVILVKDKLPETVAQWVPYPYSPETGEALRLPRQPQPDLVPLPVLPPSGGAAVVIPLPLPVPAAPASNTSASPL